MQTLRYPTKTKARDNHKCSYCDGLISKGEIYENSSHKFDGIVYTWKGHVNCGELASKLKWFDDCDYGLTQEDFIECVQYEYQKVMQNDYNDIWESEDYIYPKFHQQLAFIIKHHLSE